MPQVTVLCQFSMEQHVETPPAVSIDPFRGDAIGITMLPAQLELLGLIAFQPLETSCITKGRALLTLRLLFAYYLTSIEGLGHVVMSLSIAAAKTEQPARPNPWILPERTL